MRVLAEIFPPPPIEPQRLYPRVEAIRVARCGKGTWAVWVANGLPILKPPSGSEYVWGQDLIDFIKGHKHEKAKGSKGKR